MTASRFTPSCLGLALGAFVTLSTSPALAAPSDGWITTKTKIALVTASHVPASDVHVDTFDGRVTLSGKVETQAEKDKAAIVTKAIDGVKEVRNLVQVVPESRKKSVAESDDRIQERVAKALKEDRASTNHELTVKSVNKGVVLLEGKAQDPFAYWQTLATITFIPGVRTVEGEVKYLSEGPNEGVKSVSYSNKKNGSSAKGKASDPFITMAAKMRLIADSKVPALDVNVDTYRGNVTLFGIVPTQEAKLAAGAAVKKVDAVVTVSNELEVVSASRREFVDAKDDIIDKDVRDSLRSNAALKDINVSVKNGTVRLTGSVGSDFERLKTAMQIRGMKGVRAVEDDLRISK